MAKSKPVALPKNPAWLTQLLVLRAIVARQYQSKFGGYHLGFLWVILEPLTGVLVIGLVVGTIAQRTVPEMPYAFFLLMGQMLLHLLTGCMNSGINAIGASKNLLVYPAVKPIDPLLGRFFFQLLIALYASIVFCVAGWFLGIEFSLSRLHVILTCYLITWCMGSGLGLILGVGVAHYQELDQVMGYIQRPLLFISAVLFPSSAMPESTRKILMWNPLVHTIEQARHALFGHYNPTETNLTYPSIVALVFLALGITMFQNNRQYLTSR